MVNCGASVDVKNILDIPAPLRVYILDVFRPVYHKNIRDAEHVFVLDLEGLEDLDAVVPRDGDSADEDELYEEFGEGGDATTDEEEEEEEGGEGAEEEEEEEEGGGAGGEGGSSGGGGGARRRRRRRAAGDEGGSAGGSGSEEDSEAAGGGRARRKRLRRADGDEEEEGGGGGGAQLSMETVLRRNRRAAFRRWRAYYGDKLAAGGEGTQRTGTPAAYLAWNFVQAASNAKRRDLLWFAIVGVTSHYLAERLSRDAYDSYYVELRRDCEASRPGGEGEGEGGGGGGGGGGGVGFGRSAAPPGREGAIEDCLQEPRFVLHRHWTLYDSMRCSDYVSTRLNCWKADTPGVPSELRLLFAHCGTRPEVFEQPFTSVAKTDRVNFFARLEDNVSADEFKYKMTTRELFYPSFTRTLGHGVPHMSAADYVHALGGLLADSGSPWGDRVEAGGGGGGGGGAPPREAAAGVKWRDAWQAAYQALSRKRTDMLETGLERGKALRCAILRVVPQLVRSSAMRNGHALRWIRVGDDFTEGERRLFSQPLALAELGRFLIRVFRDSLLKWRHKTSGALAAKPLLVYLRHKSSQALYGSGADDGGWITVLMLPVGEEGADAAFRYQFLDAAAKSSQAEHTLDSFSFSVLLMKAEHFKAFLRDLDPHAEVVDPHPVA
jgi:hypothetical protein